MVPTSEENFTCNKIAIDYTLANGTTDTIETRVVEREKAV